MAVLTIEQIQQCEAFLRSCNSVHEARAGMKDACGLAFNTWRRKMREAGRSGAYAHFFGTATNAPVSGSALARLQEIPWWDIVVSPDVCPPEELSVEKVRRCMAVLDQGEEIVHGRVFFDGDRYWLSRGFDYAEAVRQGGTRKALCVEVFDGSKQDAIDDAISEGNEDGRV